MMVRRGVTAALALCLLMAPAQAQKAAPAPEKASPATPANAVDGWAGEVAASPQSGLTLDERQTAAVQTVSDYFGNLKTLKGNFVQIGADKKRMRGTFYVKRPGRFRFEYNRPSRQLIVSDGSYLAIQDLDLNNEDRVALDQTPFRLLLRSNVDLLRDARIFEVQKSEDLIVVGLQDKSPDTPGRIRIFLATSPELALKEWVTTDAQGLETRMEVSNLDLAAALDDKLFKIQMLGAHRMTP